MHFKWARALFHFQYISVKFIEINPFLVYCYFFISGSFVGAHLSRVQLSGHPMIHCQPLELIES